MQRLYIHPLPVRIWHWTNAVGFILMILTGMQIRYVGLIDVVSFRTAVSPTKLICIPVRIIMMKPTALVMYQMRTGSGLM